MVRELGTGGGGSAKSAKKWISTQGFSGGMNWEIGIDIYTLICIKWVTSKNLLYKKNK